ncbi:MAG: DUF1883 domain-containing protein [Solirubrobacterales bacterium]
MANYLVSDLGQANAGDLVEVRVKTRQNVLLVDAANYRRYRNGESYKYIGGEALRSPVRFEIPHSAHWYVVGDLGGASGRIAMDASLIRSAA